MYTESLCKNALILLKYFDYINTIQAANNVAKAVEFFIQKFQVHRRKYLI